MAATSTRTKEKEAKKKTLNRKSKTKGNKPPELIQRRPKPGEGNDTHIYCRLGATSPYKRNDCPTRAKDNRAAVHSDIQAFYFLPALPDSGAIFGISSTH